MHRRPAIVEAVEVEIRKSKKFRAKFTKELDKALDSKVLVVIDARTLPAFVTTDPNAVFDSIQSLGGRNERSGMDYGEAYTYAAGVVLNVPVVSNDFDAIRTAQRKSLPIPRMLARVFDLVVLCHQVSAVSAAECNDFRKNLVAASEFVPASFTAHSYSGALTSNVETRFRIHSHFWRQATLS